MCCIIPASIFSLCCGCMCNVIAIPIGLLVGPFILAYLVIDWFLSKIRELFKNDKELFEKFIKFSKESRIDVMTRFCVREGCDGRMQAAGMKQNHA